jgi:hypothetical protein
VVGVILSRPIKENKRYLKGRRKVPIEMGKGGPLTKADALFLDLKGFTTETNQHPRRLKTWISERTWALIDRRAAL